MCVLRANTHTGCQVLHLVPVSTKQGRFQSKLVCEPFARALHVHPAPLSAKPCGTREQTWRPTSVPKLVLPSQKLTEREHFTIKMARPSPLRGAPCTPHGCRPNEWCVEVGGIHITCNKRLYEGVVRIGAYMTGIFETQFLRNGGSLQFWP